MCVKHCKSTVTNMTLQNYEVMSDKYNVHQICIEVIHCLQKSNNTITTHYWCCCCCCYYYYYYYYN